MANADVKMSALSLAYVEVPVQSIQSGVAIDPTASTVNLAFPATGVAPVSGDWKTSSWETDATPNPDVYYARCLVGPAGAVTLVAGMYDIWVKVTSSPEIPVLKAGTLQIF